MTGTKFVDIYDGQSIVEIVVGSLKDMTAGVTGSISGAFDALVLNDEGKLSALAIWVLTFLGVGFVWKVIPMIYNFIKGRR